MAGKWQAATFQDIVQVEEGLLAAELVVGVLRGGDPPCARLALPAAARPRPLAAALRITAAPHPSAQRPLRSALHGTMAG
jgi:hypothetical protein